MAKVYRYKLWTGPTQVDATANWLDTIGFRVTCRGTEHVYVNVEADCETMARERIKVALGFEPTVVGWAYSGVVPGVKPHKATECSRESGCHLCDYREV